jgi:hypothetical protein
MSEPTTPGPPAGPAPDPAARLLELAGLVRGADHLAPEARAALAGVLAELAGALGPGGPGPDAAHLAESAAQAARALHEQNQHGLLAAARERLEAAAARAEAKAPVTTGVARRLIDLLAEIGI